MAGFNCSITLWRPPTSPGRPDELLSIIQQRLVVGMPGPYACPGRLITREDWEQSIGQAVAAAQEHHRLNPPKLPEYASRRRYRKNWWKDDYAGKIDASQL